MNTNESQLSTNPVAVIGGLLGLLPFWGLAFAALLVLQLLLDFIFLWRAQLIARWFWHLRVVLTLGAAPALLFAGVF